MLFKPQRLILREFIKDDAGYIFKLHNDPDVMRFIPHKKPLDISMERCQKFIDYCIEEYRKKPGYGLFAAIIKDTNEFIGWNEINHLDIEDNLKGEIEMVKLCEISCLSPFYFPRLFEAVTDISLSEYIRRRRMNLAARELIDGEKRVIDIAYSYGDSTPESFSRAFKSVHGIPPSMLRRANPKIKSYPKLTFTISIKGDTEMNYRIVEKEAFEVLGISITTTNKDGRNLKEILEFWQKLCDNGIGEKLWSLSANNGEMYSICFEMNENGNFKYAAAVPYQDGEKSNS